MMNIVKVTLPEKCRIICVSDTIRRRLMSKITLAVMSVMTLITLWIVIACGSCMG